MKIYFLFRVLCYDRISASFRPDDFGTWTSSLDVSVTPAWDATCTRLLCLVFPDQWSARETAGRKFVGARLESFRRFEGAVPQLYSAWIAQASEYSSVDEIRH